MLGGEGDDVQTISTRSSEIQPAAYMDAPPSADENPNLSITVSDQNKETERDKELQKKNGKDQQFQEKVQDKELKNWARRFLSVRHPHTKFVHSWNQIFIISCLLATFVDPLLFFAQSVHLELKCIVFDWFLTLSVVGLRSITDLVYLLHIVLQFRVAYISRGSRAVGPGVLVSDPKKIALKYLRGWFFMDLLVVFPLPQMVTFSVPVIRTFIDTDDFKNILLSLVLFQCVLRICRFLPMLTTQSAFGFIFETAWANIIINLFSFLLAGHIVGSCWYLFGVQRVGHCLRDACYNSHMMSSSCLEVIDCATSNKYDFHMPGVPDHWRNNTRAIACFSGEGLRYGIFLHAVNLTTEHSVVTRYFYSLFWGFQQLSKLGRNQIPSYYFWEMLFTMGIFGLGLLLLALLIGNVQNLLQAFDKRRFEMMLMRRDVDQWMSHRRLPTELADRVRQAEIRGNWLANRGVDEEILMANLPEDLQTDIRRHQFKIIKEVRIFSAMDEYVLDFINERLKKKTYTKGSQILLPGGPIQKMTFIMSGKMKIIGEDRYEAELTEGDVCGEELLLWCLEDSLRNQEANALRTTVEKPISNQRVTCITDVEVFTLGALDLKEVNCLAGNFIQKPRVQKAIRKNLAAKCIQVAWRNRMTRTRQIHFNASAAGLSRCLIPFQRDARGRFRL